MTHMPAVEVIRLKDDFLIQRPADFMFKMKIMLGFLQVHAFL